MSSAAARAGARDHDVVLLGATGFTGGLTASALAERLTPGSRWALAGRDRSRLEALRERLAADHPGSVLPDLLHADVTDPPSLRAVAEASRVLATTVGPYLQHGDAVVAACAAAGTDYADLTGEPEFVDRTWLAHHATAVATGARLVHSCGFEAVPPDLGVLFTVQQLPAGVPLRVRGVVRGDGAASGGTLASALGQVARRRAMGEAARQRRAAEPRPVDGRRASSRPGRPHRDRALGAWVLPLPTIDPVVVRRSAAARPDYGPDFAYAHYAGFPGPVAAASAAAAVAGLAGAAQVPPVRSFLQRRLVQGSGPGEERRARSWFTVDLRGEGGGERVHTRVRGGDPGYGATARMLAEAALSLAFDDADNPATAGQVTPAAAMGERLLHRLPAVGVQFSVVGAAAG